MALMTSQDRTELMAGLLLSFTSVPLLRRCMKCGSSGNIEWHHVCGRNHDYKFLAGERGHVVPLCRTCHRGRWGIHKALAQARIDLHYTVDQNERNQRAWRAFLVFLWWLDERLPDSKQQTA